MGGQAELSSLPISISSDKTDITAMSKLFVASLSWNTNNDMLREYFEQFGEVTEAAVIMERDTGRSRGFGFVTFRDSSCTDYCLKSGPHQLDGRTIEPRIAEEKGGRGGGGGGGGR